MKPFVLAIIVVGSALSGFVGWRVHAMKTQEVPHFEIVEDPSLSHGPGCESLIGLADRVLRTDGAVSGSTLTILILGDEATANEPWQLGRYSVPRSRKVLEGRKADVKRQQGIRDDIVRKCRTVRPTRISPIFLGVKQAVADLRAQGCVRTSHCELFADSDLEENVETSVRKSINGELRGVGHGFPAPINNEGIGVTFCGSAVTVGHRNLAGKETKAPSGHKSGHQERLRDTWLSLFADPRAVRFEPYCPQLPN
jgi:hypothetical protein